MNRKVLVLCTGNSCRSIIAEALINTKLQDISADSAGVKASGKVNFNAKKILKEKGIWKEAYHSKKLDVVLNNHYDLIITVCDHVKESCPIFPGSIPKIHIGFEDPDGKGYEAFVATYNAIEELLLPKIKRVFNV